jgi:N-acetylmuramoyl-L-alanine amidase
MVKVYLSASKQGDNIGTDGISEKDRMHDLMGKIVWHVKAGRGDIGLYTNNSQSSLQGSIQDSNNIAPDIHIALHSNAGGSGEGTEAYYSNYPIYSQESHRLANLVYAQVAAALIGKDRGVKPDTSLYNIGLAETRETTAVATLIELFFHDSYNDVVDYTNKVDLVAKLIALAIYDYFGMVYYVEPVRKDWLTILKENSPYWTVWESFVNKHPEVNLKGLIEKLGNKRGLVASLYVKSYFFTMTLHHVDMVRILTSHCQN